MYFLVIGCPLQAEFLKMQFSFIYIALIYNNNQLEALCIPKTLNYYKEANSKCLATVGRENSLLAGRELQQNK